MSRNVMNQYRFNGTGCVQSGIPLEVGNIRIDGFNERCFSIKVNQGEDSTTFDKDKDYHFTLKVRRDLTTDIDIRLTLRSSATNEKDIDDNYQYLDTVHLPKWSSNENNYVQQKILAVYLCGVKKKNSTSTEKETKEQWFSRERIATGEVEEITDDTTPQDGKLYYKKDTLGNITYSLYRSSFSDDEIQGSETDTTESFDSTDTLTRRKVGMITGRHFLKLL